MGIPCEVWLNETERLIGNFEFDSMSRSDATIALPAAGMEVTNHYRVEHVTHCAHGPFEHCMILLFVAAITEPTKT